MKKTQEQCTDRSRTESSRIALEVILKHRGHKDTVSALILNIGPRDGSNKASSWSSISRVCFSCSFCPSN